MSQFKLPEFKAYPVPATRARSTGDVADWGHQYLDPKVFWDQGFTGEGVVVIVIDTGVDDTHPDLQGQVIHRKDFTGETGSGFDPNGHGTWCASRIAAKADGAGVVGIAPGSKLVDLRALRGDGTGATSNVENAYQYGKDMVLPEPYNSWRRVFSVSLGSSSPSPRLERILKEIISGSGIINVCAAGNSGYREGRNTVNYPARYDEWALAVGAIDSREAVAPYSSAGDELDVVAPGSYLLGAWMDGDYAYLDGTSMATPHVAGAVALLVGKYSRELLTHEDVEMYLQVEAKDLLTPGWDLTSGSGSVVLTRYEESPPGNVEPDPDPEPEPVPTPVPDEPAGFWAWLVAIWNWLKKIFSNNQINTEMENEFKNTAQVGEWGYDEVVDTLADGCKLEMDVRTRLKGSKLTLSKAFEIALAGFPKINEAIQDWDTFENQLLDMFPSESAAVLTDVSAKLSEEEKAQSRLFRVVRFAARGHLNGEQVKAIIDEQWGLGKDIFAKD